MRFQEKIDILTHLDGLTEKLSQIFDNPSEVSNILKDCANQVIHIHNGFKQEFKKEDQTAQEQLIKLLAQTDSQIETDGVYIRTLLDEIDGIKVMVKEVQCVIHAVFFPYRSEMWSCLESIFFACQRDGHCKVDVVPIPYFEKDSNVMPKDFKYDTNYPENVPIRNYQEYDIDKEKPDIVFIHNPYDIYNNLTTVPIEYYSHYLSSKTNGLIYIPYYNARYEHSPASLFGLPCYLRCWRIFVQSEALRSRFLLHNHDPQKIKALGSPKTDSIFQIIKSPVEIPPEWEPKLRNRKVFLYNTHLIKHRVDGYGAFEELHYVLSLFANRDDVALIWRPHPLTEAAVRQNARVWSALYENFESRFLSFDNTILDKSRSYLTAFGASNAYFGDDSSLVLEFALMGKPICLKQSGVDVIYNEMSPDQIYFDYKSLYTFSDKDSLGEFINQVVSGYDPMAEGRNSAAEKAIGVPDGLVGESIWNSIKQEYEQDFDLRGKE